MYQSDTEMLFPTRVIPALKNLRGPAWKQLVETVAIEPDGSPATLAFGLMMIRLNGCLTIRDFIVHREGGGGQRTDADLIAVRFPTA